MGIKSVSITVSDKNIFYGGETVKGFCQVTVENEETPLPKLVVCLQGTARVYWAESRGKYMQWYTDWYKIIAIQQELTIQSGSLPPGTHNLAFAFPLPTNLATSYEGAFGYVRYWLETEVPTNWLKTIFAPIKAIGSVKIIQPIDNNLPQYFFPVRAEDSKTICCCCCAQGPLTVEAETDRAAFSPGEIVTINASFANMSKRECKPYAKLVQRHLHFAQGHCKVSYDEWDLTPLNPPPGGAMNPLGEGGSCSWSNLQFTIPAGSPSLTLPILRVDYYIEVGLDIPMAFDLTAYLPIVMGTIAYRGRPPVVTEQVRAAQQLATFANQASTPWRGSGAQNGGPPDASPPTELHGIEQRSSGPPPSYFETMFGIHNNNSANNSTLAHDDHITSSKQ